MRLLCLTLITFMVTGIAMAGFDPVRPQSVTAQKPAASATLQEVESLVAQLGDKQFVKRRAAKESLDYLGSSILPHLKTVLEKEKDAEIKRQLQSMIPILEQRVALSPTFLTLTCKDKPLAEVLKEIEKQSKYKIELVNGKNDKALVSLQWEKMNFWQALQSLCEQQGLMFQEGWYGNDNVTIRLMPGESISGFLHIDGPFRVTATGFYYNRTVNFNNRAAQGIPAPSPLNESLQVNLTVTVEPRMPLLMVKQPIITEAVSENNENLVLESQNNRNQYYQHGYRSYMHQIQGQLKPSATARRVKTLKGTIPVTVVAQTKPLITIDKLSDAKGKTFKGGNTVIRIDELTNERGQAGVKMSVTETTAGNGQDYTWMNSIQQRIEVYDEKGNKLQHYGGSWGMNGNNNINGTFNFSGVPAKLIYFDWITLNYQVPFSFEDLPLP